LETDGLGAEEAAAGTLRARAADLCG
jgi:hypothetical protein